MPLPFNPQTLFDLADKLGIVQAVKAKLLRQPDVAADKLVVVLGELTKIFTACEAELLRYLSLTFDKDGNIAEERKALLTLEGGQIQARAWEAKGHCHKIWNIYQNYLDKWFHRVLSKEEAEEMKSLFGSLSYADSQMEFAIHELTQWLTSEAQAVLDLVDDNKFEEANNQIKQARKAVLPTRQAISKAMNNLLALQTEFITLSKTV
jgi:hypothetical protein